MARKQKPRENGGEESRGTRGPEPIEGPANAPAEEAPAVLERTYRELEAAFHRVEAEIASLRSETLPRRATHELRLRVAAIADTAARMLKSKSIDPRAVDLTGLESNARELHKLLESAEDEGPDTRLAKIEAGLARIRAMAAALPDLAAALGLSPIEVPVEPLELNDIVEPAVYPVLKVSQTLRTGQARLRLESEGRAPRTIERRPDGTQVITEVETLGKVRLRLVGPGGEAVAGAMFQVVAELQGGGEAVLAMGTTGGGGYAAVSLSDVPRESVVGLSLRLPTTRPGASAVFREIGKAHFASHRDRAKPHVIVLLPDDVKDLVRTTAPLIDATIDDPDAKDAENAPEEFTFDAHLEDGNCCIRPSSQVPSRQFFWQMLVRLDAPLLVAGKKLRKRVAVAGPVTFGEEKPATYAILGGNIVRGRAVTYRQSWRPVKQGLGRLLYSLALAPCEEVKMAIIDWERLERATRRESRTATERLSYEQNRERAVDEVVESVLHEEQSGSAASGGGGAAFSVFGLFSIGGGGGGSSSSAEGYRNLVASTQQRISDNVSQRASSLRTQQATVVTTSVQRESERISTRVVRNHNVNHAMTVQYYEVMAHYRVVTDVHEEQDVLLIPYAVDDAIFDTIPSFAQFRVAPSRRITRFLLRHRELLEALVPERFAEAFESLSRLVQCADVYKIAAPRATASRWEVELDQAFRQGVRLFVETDDGQSVPLNVAGSGETTRFVSDPVDLSQVTGLRVSFESAEAARSFVGSFGGVPGLVGDALRDALAQSLNYRLTRVSVRARTDVNEFVPRPRSFLFQAGTVDATLSHDNPTTVVSLSAPNLANLFDEWFGRQHEDYCRLQQLVAHIQSKPMFYMRAIWLAENPDRRALRFDRFQYDGAPLLDQIRNRPAGVFGNLVAFPLLEAHRLVPAISPYLEVAQRFVSLPTRGVFAEVFLSCCNATELRDPARVIDKETGCQLSAPDITGITPGSRRSAVDLRPTDFPSQIVNIQSPTAVPDPHGMSEALQVLRTPDIFRDLSNAKALADFISATTGKAFDNVTEGQKAMVDLAKAILPALLGAVAGGAGSLSGAASAVPSLVSALGGLAGSGGGAAGGAGAAVGEVASTLLPAAGALLLASTAPDGPLGALSGAALRASAPAKVADLQQLIRQSVGRGDISREVGAVAMANLLGGTGGIAPAAFPLSAPTLREPRGRPCCVLRPKVFTVDNVLEATDLSAHVYGGGSPSPDAVGITYTCAGGFIDIGHVRDIADLCGYLGVQAAALLPAGGTLTLLPDYDRSTRTVEFKALGKAPSGELCVLLAQRIAYELAVWHEIVTWFNGGFPNQRVSSFSPEDNFSNLLGSYVGADALRDPGNFNSAVVQMLQHHLTALGPVLRADTVAAMTKVKGRWWQETLSPLADDAVLRRHFDALGNVTPWLVPGGVGPCAAAAVPVTLPVPVDDPDGNPLSDHYDLRLGFPSAMPAALHPAGRAHAGPADFAAMIAAVRAAAKAIPAFGPNADQP